MSCEMRYYNSVDANSIDEYSCTPGVGDEIYFKEVGGSACYDKDVKVEIFWGDELLLCTHGDMSRRTNFEAFGNGVTSFKIKLTNDSDSAETVGGYAIAERVINS